MLISDDDIVAVHRINSTNGAGAALVELRRRWLGLTESTAPAVLARVLAMRVAVPAVPQLGLRGARHDGPVAGRASRKMKVP